MLEPGRGRQGCRHLVAALWPGPSVRGRAAGAAAQSPCAPRPRHTGPCETVATHMSHPEPPGAQSTSGAGAGENKPWSGGHGRRRSDQESAETNQRHGRGGKIVAKAASPGFADLKSVLISKYNSQCCAKLFKAPHTKTLILFSEQGCHIQSISG